MNAAKLTAGYKRLQRGTLWSSTGKCKGYAVANPGEAQKIDAYVAALAAGQHPAPPQLATDTGAGIVTIIDALLVAPALKAVIDQGDPVVGSKATGRIVAV